MDEQKQLAVRETIIPGLYEIDLVLHGDSRGWFKENYQAEKLKALGLPDFTVVQNNFSYNQETGAIRGLHAEPWEKYISVANSSVFGAWVDIRPGASFGKVYTTTITPDKAVFVPRGVANSYQTLEANVVYTYLVNEHWYKEAKYSSVNLYDEELAINWPIEKSKSIISDKDAKNPSLDEVRKSLGI